VIIQNGRYGENIPISTNIIILIYLIHYNDRGVLVKPSFSGTQAEQVRSAYDKLADEVNSWVLPSPSVPQSRMPEHLTAIARKKDITKKHATLYNEIMRIYRCETNVHPKI
jgi:hypothetical protein